jgi:hypothetical protein
MFSVPVINSAPAADAPMASDNMIDMAVLSAAMGHSARVCRQDGQLDIIIPLRRHADAQGVCDALERVGVAARMVQVHTPHPQPQGIACWNVRIEGDGPTASLAAHISAGRAEASDTLDRP